MITQGEVLDIARDAIYNIILTSAPLLLISLIVGLIISIFQTVTSIQEQTLPLYRRFWVYLQECCLWSVDADNMTDFMTRLWSDFSLYIS